MSLGKWAANDARLLKGIFSSIDEVPVELEETVSTPGLKWRPALNTLHFSLRLAISNEVVIKRVIPVIVIPKLIM